MLSDQRGKAGHRAAQGEGDGPVIPIIRKTPVPKTITIKNNLEINKALSEIHRVSTQNQSFQGVE